VSTVIVGLICFVKPFYSVQRPLMRDIIFFVIAGFWAFYVVWDGRIALWETLGTFYFTYISFKFKIKCVKLKSWA
jgi:Ca2+/Na+ antiporter